jgi:hypothetical protein
MGERRVLQGSCSSSLTESGSDILALLKNTRKFWQLEGGGTLMIMLYVAWLSAWNLKPSPMKPKTGGENMSGRYCFDTLTLAPWPGKENIELNYYEVDEDQ